MGNKAKYSDDLMLEAVIRYAEVTEGQLTYVDVALWANNNMPELAGVTAKSFSRLVKGRDGKKVPKPCRKRLLEINEERALAAVPEVNPFLSSSDPNIFFDLSRSAQMKSLIEAREYISTMDKTCAHLKQQNRMYMAELDHLREENDRLAFEKDQIIKKQGTIKSQINYIMRRISEDDCKAILAEQGISEQSFDYIKYNAFLENGHGYTPEEKQAETLDPRSVVNDNGTIDADKLFALIGE